MSHEHAMSLEDLVTRIHLTHHVATRRLLAAMRDELDGVLEATPRLERDRLDALRRTFAHFREDLLAHLSSEERVVFPYVVALEQALTGRAPRPRAAFRSLASPLKIMQNEQDAAREAIGRVDAAILAVRTPSDGTRWDVLDELLERLRLDLEQHAHLEQEVLFPRALDVEHELLARKLAEVAASRR